MHKKCSEFVSGPSFHSSFHVVVNGLVENCQEEIGVFLCDAHGRFDAESLSWSHEQRRDVEHQKNRTQ